MSLPVDADVVAYQEGVRLFKEGKILEAIGKFRYAATHGVDRPMEHFALASALTKLGHLEEAAQEYELFLKHGDGLPQQVEAARKALTQIREVLPGVASENPEASTPVSQATASSGAPATPKAPEPSLSTKAGLSSPTAQEPAAPSHDPVRSGTDAEAAQLASQASVAQRRQRVERVRKLYEEAVAFYRASGFDSSLSRLAILEEEWGRTVEVLGLMGLCRMGQGDYDEAVALLTEAHNLVPGAGEPLLNLARAEYERGCSRAAALLERLVNDTPSTPGAWYNLGIVREARSDFEGAVQAYQKAVAADPEDLQAQACLSFAKRRIQ